MTVNNYNEARMHSFYQPPKLTVTYKYCAHNHILAALYYNRSVKLIQSCP
jgi:hypothetical protein